MELHVIHLYISLSLSHSLTLSHSCSLPLSPSPVNNIECEGFSFSSEKKDLEEQEANGPKGILPYSSMFIFGQTNP